MQHLSLTCQRNLRFVVNKITMKKFLIFGLSAIMLCANALARPQSQATFSGRVHDFGYIKESKGPVSHTFEFVNTGDKPLIIFQVTASCGCTRPEFPTKPIKPGKKGKIKVTFSPIGRPGAFQKTVNVRTNGKEKRTVLFITGTVIPKKRK